MDDEAYANIAKTSRMDKETEQWMEMARNQRMKHKLTEMSHDIVLVKSKEERKRNDTGIRMGGPQASGVIGGVPLQS